MGLTSVFQFGEERDSGVLLGRLLGRFPPSGRQGKREEGLGEDGVPAQFAEEEAFGLLTLLPPKEFPEEAAIEKGKAEGGLFQEPP